MIVAESEKQQELSVKESERARLQEHFNNSQRELKATCTSLDRAKREAVARADQDREAINRLTAEIKNFKAQFSAATEAHEAELGQLGERMKALNGEKEQVEKEGEELVQMPLVMMRSNWRWGEEAEDDKEEGEVDDKERGEEG